MPLKVCVVGNSSDFRAADLSDSLIIRVLEIASGSKIELSGVKSADLVLMYPYRYPFRSTVAGAAFESATKHLIPTNDRKSSEKLLRRLYRIPRGKRILVITHENLDRQPWKVFGRLLSNTDLPRLTFWPNTLDSPGFRFPYWWNYINWPEISRPDFGARSRFGALYDLDVLCSTSQFGSDFSDRKNKAVWLTSHFDFPRNNILHMLRESIEVDIIHGVPWGQKYDLLSQYQYCVAAENSTGYGYETEKLPEAVISGCIPIGYVQNPFSDFDKTSFFWKPPQHEVTELPPLLNEIPTLDGLIEYLGNRVISSIR
jgi:hypothetical protein